MAEPNYMAYAQYMGARNPMAEGINQISGTLSDIQKRGVEREDRTRRNSLADLQMRRGEMEMQGAQAQLQDQQAQQGARQSLYGVNNPQDAYLAEMKATQEAAKRKQRAEMSAKHLDSIKTYKSLGMRPEFLTEYTKAEMMKDPELAPMAQYVSFADDTKMEITKPFKDNELRNPMNPQEFLPAGTYKVIGTATGNPEQPYQFNKIEPIEQKAEYKFREYNKGNTTIAEESQDGGKTWKPVSSAPRYKPAAPVSGNGRNGGYGKPLPPAALKLQQEAVDAIGTASSINADLDGVLKLIDSGKLDLGLVSNTAGKALNYVGLSTESSRNLNTFKATLEKLRNDSLRLNKGVQTDGDAQRAWNELLSNINDPDVVKQRLTEIGEINKRAVTLQEANIENIRNNYGASPLDTTKQKNVKGAIGNTGKRPPLSAIFGK